MVSCDACWAGTYHAYVFSDGTVSHCLLTRAQVPVGNGREGGWAAAFEALPRPVGPGCSCVPSFEVNRILDYDVRALTDALDVSSMLRR